MIDLNCLKLEKRTIMYIELLNQRSISHFQLSENLQVNYFHNEFLNAAFECLSCIQKNNKYKDFDFKMHPVIFLFGVCVLTY